MIRPLLHPVAFMDLPRILDCSVNSIPGSASSPYQIVASLSQACHAIDVLDGIGKFVELYQGANGQEKYVTTLSPGINEVLIAKGARLSLRSGETVAITSGKLELKFLGAQK